jgi:hypothetical protein
MFVKMILSVLETKVIAVTENVNLALARLRLQSFKQKMTLSSSVTVHAKVPAIFLCVVLQVARVKATQIVSLTLVIMIFLVALISAGAVLCSRSKCLPTSQLLSLCCHITSVSPASTISKLTAWRRMMFRLLTATSNH